MFHDWQELTMVTGGERMTVERVRLGNGVAIEGAFELPPLARLSAEDQVFVSAFVRCHGSIKEMESVFGVSYPTIKNRLNRIGARLPLAEVVPPQRRSADELLAALERGELTVTDVLSQLRSAHAGND